MRHMFTNWTPSPGETFRFLRHAWDVQKAKELLIARKRPLPVVEYDLDELRQLLSVESFDKDGKLLGFSLGVSVEWDRIRADIAKPEAEQQIDLNVPVILVLTPEKSGLVIDGYHRIGKAVLLKRTKLPAVVLPFKDSMALKVL